MEPTAEEPSQPEINGPDSPADSFDGSDSPTGNHNPDRDGDHDRLLAEMDSLRQAYESLRSKSAATEDHLLLLQHEKEEAVQQSGKMMEVVEELSRERDTLHGEIVQLEASYKGSELEIERKMEEGLKEREEIKRELEVSRERIAVLESEKEQRSELFSQSLDSINSVKENLVKIIECLDDDKVIEREKSEIAELKLGQQPRALWEETQALSMLASKAEARVSKFKEAKKKETKELENSVVSLTEENRDINSLLRIALVEKEAVEKSLNRLRGNSEQKRVALLQFAERGLQRVGFGFMMGSGSNEQPHEGLGGANVTTGSNKSDSSDCEEEVDSLASTVERIMKNLRNENTQLRRSLEESRSDTERLQSLTEKQAKTMEENTLYIKELEDRERVLAQNVEELLLEIKATEEDVARWREACEMEVEAGKSEIEERDKVVEILKQELEKIKAALEVSNSKLKLKEELAAAAMAAQAASETSLQMADSRAAGLRERIEELTKQLEEAESKERSQYKVRRICWPWRVLINRTSTTNGRVQNVRRMLPEMQALLH